MPTVAVLLKDHVALEVECVDRIYLNGYIPNLQTGGYLAIFLTKHRKQPIASPALLERITSGYRDRVKAFVAENGLPYVEFKRGERKDDLAQAHRAKFSANEGVVFVGVAQEKAMAFKAHKIKGEGVPRFDFQRQSVAVNHYYFYLQDVEFGPAFIKICSYAPYGMRLCLNGHEWVKRQLAKEGIAYEALDNGFRSCANPKRLQELCDALGPHDFQAFLDRWLPRLPFPLTDDDLRAGYRPQLSIWQLEVSLTQVFERPLQGRQFFEQVIKENLDLGRPDHVQLVFGRAVRKNTPSRFRTRVIQHGVLPSLHIEYKHSQIKQYFKENHALRTETTINNPKDFSVNKGLPNFDTLRTLGREMNRRLLDAQQVTSPSGLSQAGFDHVVQPTVTPDGQRAPGLRFGDPRTRALFLALILFSHFVYGFTHAGLRPHVAQLLGPQVADYGASKMTYDLRRLRLKGLIARVPRTHRYELTPYGRNVALFFSKVDGRLFGQADLGHHPAGAATTTRLTRALRQVDDAVNAMVDESGLQSAA